MWKESPTNRRCELSLWLQSLSCVRQLEGRKRSDADSIQTPSTCEMSEAFSSASSQNRKVNELNELQNSNKHTTLFSFVRCPSLSRVISTKKSGNAQDRHKRHSALHEYSVTFSDALLSPSRSLRGDRVSLSLSYVLVLHRERLMYADCKPISISVLGDVYVCRLRGAKGKKKMHRAARSSSSCAKSFVILILVLLC